MTAAEPIAFLQKLLSEVQRGRREGWLDTKGPLYLVFASQCEATMPVLLARVRELERENQRLRDLLTADEVSVRPVEE